MDGVADLGHGRRGQLQRFARPVGVDETVHDLGVEHEVLAARARGHRVHPAGRVDLARAGLAGHVRRAAHEPVGEEPGAVVVARRALVALHRGDGVGQQLHRVGHRLDAAAAEAEVAGVFVPVAVDALLHAVGEVPVGGVVVGGGGRRGSENQHRDKRGEERAEHRVVLVLGRSWGVPKTFPDERLRAHLLWGWASHPKVDLTPTLGASPVRFPGPYALCRA